MLSKVSKRASTLREDGHKDCAFPCGKNSGDPDEVDPSVTMRWSRADMRSNSDRFVALVSVHGQCVRLLRTQPCRPHGLA
jgi:hypothetical protein